MGYRVDILYDIWYHYRMFFCKVLDLNFKIFIFIHLRMTHFDNGVGRFLLLFVCFFKAYS